MRISVERRAIHVTNSYGCATESLVQCHLRGLTQHQLARAKLIHFTKVTPEGNTDLVINYQIGLLWIWANIECQCRFHSHGLTLLLSASITLTSTYINPFPMLTKGSGRDERRPTSKHNGSRPGSKVPKVNHYHHHQSHQLLPFLKPIVFKKAADML